MIYLSTSSFSFLHTTNVGYFILYMEHVMLWKEEILHHQKDGWNPINSGKNMDKPPFSTGAGFHNHPPYR